MLSFGSKDCNPLCAISVRLKTSSTHFLKCIIHKSLASVSLLGVLSFTGVHWLTMSAIAPQNAQAYTATVNVALNRQPRESYNSLVRRAEAVARAAAQRSFDRDILVTDVAVTVLGQNEGSIAPVLMLKVNRQAWRNRPDTQYWATYFRDSQTLLGLNKPSEEPALSEPVPPTPEPVPAAPEPFPTPGPDGSTTIPIPGAPIRIIPRPGASPQPGGPAGVPPQQAAPPQPGGSPGVPAQQAPPIQQAPPQQGGGQTILDIPGARNRIITNPGNPLPAPPTR